MRRAIFDWWRTTPLVGLNVESRTPGLEKAPVVLPAGTLAMAVGDTGGEIESKRPDVPVGLSGGAGPTTAKGDVGGELSGEVAPLGAAVELVLIASGAGGPLGF